MKSSFNESTFRTKSTSDNLDVEAAEKTSLKDSKPEKTLQLSFSGPFHSFPPGHTTHIGHIGVLERPHTTPVLYPTNASSQLIGLHGFWRVTNTVLNHHLMTSGIWDVSGS